jgi:hypothetical protein
MAQTGPSGEGGKLATSVKEQALDEQHYGEIDAVLLYLENARRRAERAAAELRATGGDDHLVDALETVQDDLSEAAKKLRQGTFFAVPSAQLTL